MKLKFKKINISPFFIIIGILSFLLPYIFIEKTNLIAKCHYIWLVYFEIVSLLTIFIIWYKIYYELIFARIDNNILYYKQLFFFQKSIKLEDLKGYKIGSEDTDFYIIINKNDKKLFKVRMDFYSNYYDFIDELKIKEIGPYKSSFQKIICFFLKRS